ncbi:hypothetical protein [Knoellia sp. LjRoot47]|uniref:hypothetical protein n=1 Tax=Knoellia sp. LjRoot47 TaxID=3342330 RepID=UPI003ED0B04E
MEELAALGEDEEWLSVLVDAPVDEVGRLLDECLGGLGVSDTTRMRLGELLEGVWWSGGGGSGDRQEVIAAIVEAVPAVSGTTAEPMLALYIRAVCEAAWELTWDHAPITDLLRAAESEWDTAPPTPGSSAALAVRAMTALRADLRLESACSTGDLGTESMVSAEVRDTLQGELDSAHGQQSSAVARHVVSMLQDRVTYAAAVHEGSAAALAFLEGRADSLDAAWKVLHEAEQNMADHGARSELRAHRVAIERLCEARHEDWLRVDEGSIVCTYPFGLRHTDQATVVRAVKEHAGDWVMGGRALANNSTGLLLVDDVWRGDDPLERRYEGTQLDLPDLHLIGRQGRDVTARVTIVISQLGNHHVRVELPLVDALPHDIAARVWMAAPEYADLDEVGQRLVLGEADGTRPDQARGWSRLSGVVQTLLDDLVHALVRTGLENIDLSFRPGMYHVVTTINEASVLPSGDAGRAHTLDHAARIPTLFGSQSVCHPIPAGIGSLAFWARYGSPVGTPVECAGLTDEYLLASENHTLIASFSSPDFMVATVGQAAEFAASLDGMFAAWQDELSDFYLGLTPHLRRLESPDDVDLQEVLSDLEHRHLRLRQFLTSARVTVLFISSPALVTSPVMRSTISRLLDLRPVWVQRADFTDIAGQALADRVTDLIETWMRRRDDAQARRNRLRIDTMIAVLTGIGISGVVAILQTGFDVEKGGSVALAVVVLLLAALVGLASFRWSRLTNEKRSRPSSTRSHRSVTDGPSPNTDRSRRSS